MAKSKPNRKTHTQVIQLKDKETGKLTGKVRTIHHTIPHKKL